MELSAGWVKCFLGDIVNLRNGYAFKSTEYQQQGIPIIRISDINDGVVEITDSKCIYQNEEFENFTVDNGDILIAMSGATTGKFGIYKGTAKAYQNQRVGNLKPVSESNSSKLFIFYLLYSLKRRIEKDAYGGAQPNISGSKVELIEIALPPLNEQHRIVAKIEELFSELDKGIENLKTARAQLKVYRQALLKHAFEGKLTAQWRAENRGKLETAEALLKRIQQERAERYQQQLADWQANGGSKPKAPKPLPPLTAEELAELPELPEGWGWFKLVDISDVSGGLTKNQKRNSLPIRRPFLRVGNVYANRLELGDMHNTGISEAEIERVTLVKGDILVVEGNGSVDQIGRVAVWNGTIDGCVHQNHLIKARPLSLACSEFILYFLMSELGRKFIVRAASSTSGLHTLSISKVESLFVPLCASEEQDILLRELSSKLSLADQLDQTIATSLQQAEALRQSILKRAFSGQLVPQDSHDEPASKLLERIRAERADVVAKPRKTAKDKA